MAEEPEVARIRAALNTPGLKYRSFGNPPIRAEPESLAERSPRPQAETTPDFSSPPAPAVESEAPAVDWAALAAAAEAVAPAVPPAPAPTASAPGGTSAAPPPPPSPVPDSAPPFALLDALGQLPPAPPPPAAAAPHSTLSLLRGAMAEHGAAPGAAAEPKPAAAVARPLAEVMRQIAEGLAAKEAARAASRPAAR
ncbi:MAG: hypothetical protein N3D18_03645 [Roseococcus sp.]|nr:hypothetical protein [Roseococcus sp.]